jgi:type IV secretion system protein VirB9
MKKYKEFKRSFKRSLMNPDSLYRSIINKSISVILAFSLFNLFIFMTLNDSIAVENKPIAIDSRIKTYVYSENEVFRLVVHYGYQTSIEFADGEEMQTISVGNNYAWQLTPVGRRLFIKPLEENILTNMTILTNKRSYQFEIQSKLLSYTIDEELVYVVRFFYPDENFDTGRPVIDSVKSEEPIPVIKPFNFNYTLSGGDDKIAPIKVFDDGTNTFFKFDSGVDIPKFEYKKGNKYKELQPRRRSDFIILNTIAKEFRLTRNDIIISVYNENMDE